MALSANRRMTLEEYLNYEDAMVLTEAGVAALSGKKRSLITLDMPAPAPVVEVVSPGIKNWQRNYDQKQREYAALGIGEYWLDR